MAGSHYSVYTGSDTPQVDVLVMRRAARTIQRYLRAAQARRAMMEQCRGVLEKQGQVVLPLFGKLELVVWKAHFVYVTATDLCYERLRKDKTPDPSTTKARRVAPPRPRTSDCISACRCPSLRNDSKKIHSDNSLQG